jgi:hypothetical protein
MLCIAGPEDLYAFAFQPEKSFETDSGWTNYDTVSEFKRLGVETTSNQWRFSNVNAKYEVLQEQSRYVSY